MDVVTYPDPNAHDDVIKWKHFPRYWPFVRGIHRPPVNSPHKGRWRGALMFSLICVKINGWENNREAGDLRRYRAHYDVIKMQRNHISTKVPRSRRTHKIFRDFNIGRVSDRLILLLQVSGKRAQLSNTTDKHSAIVLNANIIRVNSRNSYLVMFAT